MKITELSSKWTSIIHWQSDCDNHLCYYMTVLNIDSSESQFSNTPMQMSMFYINWHIRLHKSFGGTVPVSLGGQWFGRTGNRPQVTSCGLPSTPARLWQRDSLSPLPPWILQTSKKGDTKIPPWLIYYPYIDMNFFLNLKLHGQKEFHWLHNNFWDAHPVVMWMVFNLSIQKKKNLGHLVFD